MKKGLTLGAIEIRKKILKLCSRDFHTTTELAESLGKSVNTIRAHYVYQMVREGLLVTMLPTGSRNGQKYKAAPIKYR